MPSRTLVTRALHRCKSPAPSPTVSHPKPKPHLANYSLQQPRQTPSETSFASPHAPQLPKPRRPVFSPGGFGLHSSRSKGKHRADQAATTTSEESEASYEPPTATLSYHSPNSLPLLYSPEPLPPYDLAYETWGKLNPERSNAILIHTGLSASSHAASGGNGVSSNTSSKSGWWESFVGPGKCIDTDRFFVICTNVLGGCFGSTGPSSPYPLGEGNVRWATRFPLLSIHDMIRAQLGLLDHLGIEKLYASIGSSMGGMSTLSLAYMAPERVGKVASISATGRSGLNGVGMRYAQRSVLMADPNWNRGNYYDGVPPHNGMKLARQIATITYRSGPEWEERFGRRMLSEQETDEAGHAGIPKLGPDFLIETYLDHQGERFCLTYDANSMIYISKAMDLFDMTAPALTALAQKFSEAYTDPSVPPFPFPNDPTSITASRPSDPRIPTHHQESAEPDEATKKKKFIPTSKSPHLRELAAGLKRLKDIPMLVLGVQSDVLFPVEQQRELADALTLAGNEHVTYYELGGVWGHDTFLLDLQGVGNAIRGFLGSS
ncbi:Alpha/Beta hydrolase protein [Kockovaella imperatae]|uniref:Alpha/Beta hydrolase protein n=1 Tax=Kockovaella imperatae TaxID=4999 RepID=A0A1Y1UJJ5_9TREE|nr:Alpha/Beta hydrolase protein [Kockovaella imperatae]ORX37707.1 Alpha/Beta hydrolase protein [Kockovaella imperatae]